MKMSFSGLDTYLTQLNRLDGSVEDIMDNALYNGADVMTDEVRKSIEMLPAINDVENIKAYKAGEKSKLTKGQKEGLLNSLGIAPFERTTKEINTLIGFQGYNDIKTKKYPNGQPNMMIARVVESGSSYMDKTPFMRKTANRAKKQTEKVMQQIVENEIEKIMKE